MPLRLLGVMFLVVLAGGCDAGKPTYPAARLGGSVTLDGEPISQGSLQFVPQDAGKSPITQTAIANGRYVAEAVPRGKLRVLITASKETGKMIKEYSTPRPEIINVVPDKYRNGIPLEVTGDNANQDFALKSR